MPFITRANSSNVLPPILSHISSSSLQALQQESHKTIHPQSMFWYPIDFVVYLFCLWIIALCSHDFIFPSRFFFGGKWKTYGINRRVMIVYLLSILVTFIAFVLQLASSSIYYLHYTTTTSDMVRTAGTLITVLYLFEMIYREKMRFAMICHHCLTIFAIAFVIVLLDKKGDPSLIITGSLWLYQATTEQLTFIALFGYRMEWHPKVLRPMLQVAAIQSLLVKIASILACIVVWVKYQRPEGMATGYIHAWDAIFWVAAIGLMVTQFWGSWVVWKMGTSLEVRYEKKRLERREMIDNFGDSSEDINEKALISPLFLHRMISKPL